MSGYDDMNNSYNNNQNTDYNDYNDYNSQDSSVNDVHADPEPVQTADARDDYRAVSSDNSYSAGYGYGRTTSHYGSDDRYSADSRQDRYDSGSRRSTGAGNGNKGSNGGKKKGGLLKRAAALAMSAVLFGGVAGGTMVGIQYAAQKNGVIAGTSSAETNAAGESAGSKTSVKTTTSNTSLSGAGTVLNDVSDVVETVLPSVVAITNKQIYENYQSQFTDPWSYFFNFGNGQGGRSGQGGNSSGESQEIEAGAGSGIIIAETDDELLIVTNYHVIENADALTINFADGSEADANIKGTDSSNDLAVVAVDLDNLSKETMDAIAIASLHTADDLKVGQGVIAIGNALGYGQSITVGYISALDRSVATSDGTTSELLQTDAAINPGNSGGALINEAGEIIGINSAKYSDTDVEGMGFAIPIYKVVNIIDDLMNTKTKIEVDENQRGYLGIQGVTVDSSTAKNYNMPSGVYVYKVLDGGAASSSELQEKDIITSFNGTAISSMEELSEQLKYCAIGDKVTLKVQRQNGANYEELDIEVTLAKQVNE